MKKAKFQPGITSLTLSQAHSLIVPHTPKGIDIKDLSDKVKSSGIERVESFGLFGDTPNYNTFYPELTEEDWVPKNSDYINPMFRLFSEVYVVKNGVPIDFATNGVLKPSARLLKGVSVNADHQYSSIGNAMGVVKDVYWQEAYKIGELVIPAGINGKLQLDAKSNPRIARGILMNPPSIHSNSVTVNFKWEKSHLDLEDFWEKVGSFDKDGNLIRLIVTEIVSYVETSLVYRGADIFAQKLDETGKIVNPDYAKAVYAFSASQDKEGCTGLSCGFDFKTLSQISNSLEIFKPINNKNMNFTELLESLGLPKDLTSEQFIANFKDLVTGSELLKALLKVKPDLKADSLTALVSNQIPEGVTLPTKEELALVTSVTEKLKDGETFETLTEKASNGDSFLQTVRQSATTNYKLIMGETEVDPKIVEAIEAASLAQARSFETMYSSMVEKSIPLTCKSCGSTDVSRASHVKEPEKPGTDSYRDSVDRAAKSHHRRPSDIHGK